VQEWIGQPDGLETVTRQLPERPRTAGAGTGGSGPAWRRSSRSGGHGNCVEIAWRQGAGGINILVRDSKFPGQEPLVFTPREWAGFLERVKTGDFDELAYPPEETGVRELPRGNGLVTRDPG
jgi:Domain of unknown function (DUF397)